MRLTKECALNEGLMISLSATAGVASVHAAETRWRAPRTRRFRGLRTPGSRVELPSDMIRDIVRYGDPRLLAENAGGGPAARGFRGAHRRHGRDLPRGAGHRSGRAADRRQPAAGDHRPLRGRGPDGRPRPRQSRSSSSPRASRRRRRGASRSRTSPRRSSGRSASACGRRDASGVIREIEGTGLLARALSPRDRSPERTSLRAPPERLEARADLEEDRALQAEGDLVSAASFNTLGRRLASSRRSKRGTSVSTPAARRSTTSCTSATCARSSWRTSCAGTCAREGLPRDAGHEPDRRGRQDDPRRAEAGGLARATSPRSTRSSSSATSTA